MWNQALTEITGIDAGEAVGSQLQDLPNPWYELLHQFLREDEHHTYKNNFQLNGQKNLLICIKLTSISQIPES